MAGLALGDVVEVTLKTTLHDQRCLNTFYYEVVVINPVAPSVVTDLQSIATEIDTNAGSIYNKWRAAIPVTNSIKPFGVQMIKPHRSVRIDKVPTNIIATRGNTSSTNLSAVITRGTDSGARGQVGSIHLPGVADADVAAGELDAALLVAMDNLAGAMLSLITVPAGGVQISPVLFHPDIKDPLTHVVTRPWFITQLTRAFPQPQARVMRRRTVGVGE